MKLTEQDRVVLSALGESPASSGLIARAAKIRTSSPGETAARHCIKLTKVGLAVKSGTRTFPAWAITPAGRAALQEGKE